MVAEQAGWYYLNGQLRYKDGNGWTDRYKAIERPGANATSAKSEPSDQAGAHRSPDVKTPHRRMSLLVTATCAGLLGLGVGGGLKTDVFSGLISWATEQVGQVSTLISPPAPPSDAKEIKAKSTPRQSASPKIAPVR